MARRVFAGLPPMSTIIREMFSQVDNPEATRNHAILATARARWVQLGGRDKDMQLFNVEQCRRKMRSRQGKPLTKEKVLADIAHCNQILQSTGRFQNGTIVQIGGKRPGSNKGSKPSLNGTFFSALSAVKEARSFADLCGGVGNAIQLLEALKGDE